MIDLAVDPSEGGRCLRQTLSCEGGEVPVDTSFRAWLAFGRALREDGIADPRVLRGPALPGWADAAVAFFADEQELPRSTGGSGARALDYDADAPLIVAAFRQAYGIDLTDPGTDLHWHLFLCLLRCVPGETLLAQVMSWRAWTPGRRSAEEDARARRDAWALPGIVGAEREEALRLQMEWFGDVGRG